MEYDLVGRLSALNMNEEITSIIIIQKWYRGCIVRLKRLPTVMYVIKSQLDKNNISFSNASNDGRVNSCLDEKLVIEQLSIILPNRITLPRIRMWYDIAVYDYKYGWLPVNIKTTRTTTSDNTGNIAMCVYAYTDVKLELNNIYTNGYMSNILFTKLRNKEYNTNHKKDYYFIVLNKLNNSVIVNSVKGLVALTPNINNLPFQVKWNKNTAFYYGNITKKVNMFIECIQKPKQGWRETFIYNMRSIDLKTR